MSATNFIVTAPDGRSARVTRRAGSFGYWFNGTRTEPFDSAEAAAADFVKA